VDQTGIQGTYTFNLAWVPAAPGDPANPPDPSAGPTLFEALDSQLGLKLEGKKLPQPVISQPGAAYSRGFLRSD
jgi:uncharacterized protein (TIGR03435 family)